MLRFKSEVAKSRANEPNIPDIPRVYWLADSDGSAKFRDGVLTMKARAKTDWFNDPAGVARTSTAPALVFPLNQDCKLSARVSVHFEKSFDAGLLFVHQTMDEYAKLCFERSPLGETKIVTVVTRDFSDDADGPAVTGEFVHLQVSRKGPVIAFHFSADGKYWTLARLFRFRNALYPTTVGFAAQSPVGHGCTAKFDRIVFTLGTPPDSRLLSEVSA